KSNQPISRLHLWNTATQAKAGEWLLPGNCSGLAFSGDGRTLLTAIDEPHAQFMVWDMEAKEVRKRLPTASILRAPGTAFAASRDLHWVATGLTNDWIRVTDLTSGQVAWESNVGVTVESLAIDPAGTTLAAGIQKGSIQLYHLATGQENGRLPIRIG